MAHQAEPIVATAYQAEAGGEAPDLGAFRARVLAQGRALYRDLPWRRTTDPYEIWLSEVMLQQTQVSRVDGRWQRWLERFPSVDALAAAQSADVLAEWQGMGYNRRALALHRAAQTVAGTYGGVFPRDARELEALPGIGPATAAGILAFAFDLPGVYLETNVRAVFLHELFPGAAGVPDRELVPLVRATCPASADDPEDDPRTWYYALLDYGYELKRSGHNAARRSATHVRAPKFEGSRRQKRAELVRLLLAVRDGGAPGAPVEELAAGLSAVEREAGRAAVDLALVESILSDLAKEGFCAQEGELWHV